VVPALPPKSAYAQPDLDQKGKKLVGSFCVGSEWAQKNKRQKKEEKSELRAEQNFELGFPCVQVEFCCCHRPLSDLAYTSTNPHQHICGETNGFLFCIGHQKV